MSEESQKAFHYYKDNKSLRAAVCILMREYGFQDTKEAESDDECIDIYLSDDDGVAELIGFENAARDILEASRQHIIDKLQSEEMVEKIAASYAGSMGFYWETMVDKYIDRLGANKQTFREHAKAAIKAVLEGI